MSWLLVKMAIDKMKKNKHGVDKPHNKKEELKIKDARNRSKTENALENNNYQKEYRKYYKS